ncbi:hypothetical protein F4703DRAFT_1792678 [Phycomyces blakesleeanus]
MDLINAENTAFFLRNIKNTGPVEIVAAAASGGRAANNSSENDNSDSVGASSISTNHSLRDTKEKVTEDLEYHSFDELGENFFLDKDSTHHNEAAQILASSTKIPNKPLTHVCHLLLNKLANCAPSTRLMRELIRSSPLNTDEPFDLSINADLIFTEVMGTHFHTGDLITVKNRLPNCGYITKEQFELFDCLKLPVLH